MVDRYILTLLVQPLKAELGVSDFQLGLLIGVAFAVLYSLVGIPIAQAIDRGRRKVILAGGVILWSAATILSGLATDYAHLFVLRAGVAIGEAVLTPAAVSLIADMFDRNERALPTSIYMAVSGIMGTGAFAVGGVALDLAEALAPSLGLPPWRAALILVGAPGVLLAVLIILTVAEPQRRVEGPSAQDPASQKGWSYLIANRRLYLPFYLGVGVLNIFSMGLVAWLTTFLVRAHGIEPAEAGYLFSIAGVPAGAFGSFLWPWIAGKLEARGRADASFVLLAVTAVLVVPLAWLVPAAPSATITALLVGVIIVVVSANTTLPLLIIQAAGPGWIRGRLTAICLLAYGLIGLALGPVLVAGLGERLPQSPRALGLSLALTATGAGLTACGCFLAACKPYRHSVENLAAGLPASSPVYEAQNG